MFLVSFCKILSPYIRYLHILFNVHCKKPKTILPKNYFLYTILIICAFIADNENVSINATIVVIQYITILSMIANR
jgi:hypothetical protein